MEDRTQAALVAVIGFAGAVLLLGLTVYPFQYGLRESLLLVGILVAVAVLEGVLDGSSF